MAIVKLLGQLGELFGHEFEMEVRSPAEAIRALSYQLKGFRRYLIDSSDDGVYWRVIAADPQGLTKEELSYPLDSDVLIIRPIITGSGGFGRILLGAVLIGAAFALPGGILGLSSTTIGLMGASLVIDGLAQVLTAPQKTPKSTERKDSFLFDRAAESGKQGLPVPLLYGERIITLDIVLSSKLVTNEIPV